MLGRARGLATTHVMMMMKGICRVALVMGMVAFSAASAEAVQVKGSWDDAGHEVRVVNNYQSPVRVYVQDVNGRMHLIGRVARGQFKVLEVSAEIADMDDVRLKVYPNERRSGRWWAIQPGSRPRNSVYRRVTLSPCGSRRISRSR